MNICVSGRFRNHLFLALMALTIISLIFSLSAAAERDRQLSNDYKTYLEADKLIKQNKFAEAESIMSKIAARYSDSYEFLWRYGLCMAANGKLADGAKFIRKAAELRPVLLLDSIYLLQYGEILYHIGDYDKAERYIMEAKSHMHRERDYEMIKMANNLIEQIHTMKNSKR